MTVEQIVKLTDECKTFTLVDATKTGCYYRPQVIHEDGKYVIMRDYANMEVLHMEATGKNKIMLWVK